MGAICLDPIARQAHRAGSSQPGPREAKSISVTQVGGARNIASKCNALNCPGQVRMALVSGRALRGELIWSDRLALAHKHSGPQQGVFFLLVRRTPRLSSPSWVSWASPSQCS